jgi:transcriptional regulator with XRE-family HTH domain
MELLIYSDVQQILADKIYRVRKKQKLTQKEISKKTGIPLSTYQRLEQEGEGSLKNFAKILTALGRADEVHKILNVSHETPMEVYERLQRG